MYTVADVLRPDFELSWQEAVAIVQEVAAQLGPGRGVPDAAELLFDEDGSLRVGSGTGAPEYAVAGLAGLLLDLLQRTGAPAALSQLASGSASAEPVHTTVAEFSRVLAFYERPARSSDLQAIVDRLRAAQALRIVADSELPSRQASGDADFYFPGFKADPEVDTEFERLRRKVIERPPSPDPSPSALARMARLLRTAILRTVSLLARIARVPVARRRELAAVVGILALFALAHYLLRAPSDSGEQPEAEAAEPAPEGLLTRALIRGLELAGLSAPAAAEPRTASPESPAPQPKPSAPSRAAATRTAVPAKPIQSVRAAPPLLAPEGGTGTTGPAAEALAPSPPRPEPDLARVYSPADEGVDSPVFIRPQLPKEPPPGADTGYFDIVVSETGDVERVRLISPTRRFHDRMLVAAAKAWKFEPAKLEGQPVKYQMRVPINVVGLP